MARKVFNLQCSEGHRFEGWFASHESLDDQSARGLLRCPICDTDEVTRMPTAARLSLSGASEPQVAQPVDREAALAMMLSVARAVARQCDDVGDQFAEEARRIHYAEAPERNIMGRTSAQEAEALREEGIEVIALPIPTGLLAQEH
ncbi:MAG: DUF1178 family protein [Betaproteobacteria bacterium]|nr:DUF1178 family protein [Betaproteobacteria bacterium]